MAEEPRTSRTIRLTGLGETLKDRIDDLKAISTLARSEKDKAEIETLVEYLKKAEVGCKVFCKAWSRSFEVK